MTIECSHLRCSSALDASAASAESGDCRYSRQNLPTAVKSQPSDTGGAMSGWTGMRVGEEGKGSSGSGGLDTLMRWPYASRRGGGSCVMRRLMVLISTAMLSTCMHRKLIVSGGFISFKCVLIEHCNLLHQVLACLQLILATCSS